MKFCIYTNSFLPDTDVNDEHIFPLTLGGHDQFTIKVAKTANTLVNKELDEKLKACFLLARNRRIYNSKGHRNKKPSPPKVKISVGSDQSVVLKFDKNDYLQLYSHKEKRILNKNETYSNGILFKIPYERNLKLRFTAKIALASGYFIYGNLFVKNAETEELRALMNYKGKEYNENIFKKITTQGWWWGETVKNSDKAMHVIFETINSILNTTFVAIITSIIPDRILIVVGVLGELTGILNCSANCKAFPKHGDYDLGHVVVLKEKGIQRFSYRNCLKLI